MKGARSLGDSFWRPPPDVAAAIKSGARKAAQAERRGLEAWRGVRRLGERDSAVLAEALGEPPEPGASLREAAERYRRGML